MDVNNKEYAAFKDNFVNVFHKLAPKKTKIFRSNQKPNVSKTLSLAIMTRSRLKNKADKIQLSSDKKIIKKVNLATKLNKQYKKEYFKNIEENTESKNFWNKCKPYFSNKWNSCDFKILLTENEEIINESAKVANVFNSYFESVKEFLDLFNWVPEPYDQDSVESIIQRFSHHPSFIKIKQNIKISKTNIFHTSNSWFCEKHYKRII